jgi:hypothetical protein
VATTTKEDNMGIDYGLGQTNIDHKTGIRYGVIGSHALMPEALDDFEPDYGDPSCPGCGVAAVEYDDDKHSEYRDVGSSDDYACEDCQIRFSSDNAFPEEPLANILDDGEYKAEMGEDGDVFVTQSPYFTLCGYCSPCAPGAGYLTNKAEDCKAYCLGHDWFEGQAPYTVYRVEDDSIVTP